MYKWSIRFAVLAAICVVSTVAMADPTTGFTLQPVNFKIQSPYNLPVSDRYSFDPRTNTHHFWVFNTDQPFSEGNTTDPRTEMRFDPDYTTATTQMQFEADIMVPAGTNNVSVFQVHVGDAQSDTYGSTSLMLFVYGGKLRYYSSGTVIINSPYGKWFHLNVIHNTSTMKFSVYINNVLTATFTDAAGVAGATDWYFKCGVYGQSGQSALTQAYYRNVHIWSE